MIRYQGVVYDIAKPVRCFQRYDHNQRADIRASHRQGFRARERVGEFFYVHELIPGRAFTTYGDAVRAALSTLAGATP